MYDFLTKPLSPWQDGGGELTDIVIDSRIRLSRNLKNYVFPGRASESELAAVAGEGRRLMPCLQTLGRGSYEYIGLDTLRELEKEMLAAKHVASAGHIACPANRAVMVRSDGAVSIMLNEQDHFCIQTAAPGFAVSKAWDDAAQVDDALESHVNFAFRDDFGYLTASPSVTGTGLIAGVTVHVPALVLMKRLNRVVQGITKLGFAVCGMYGERGDCIGNIFQITNQITLGVSEEEILEQLGRIVTQVVQEERNCRQVLWSHDEDMLRDKFSRAAGILSQAWLLSEQEGISLLSDMRFGIDMGVIPRNRLLYEALLMAMTPAFLQSLAGKELDEGALERLRAATVRQILSEEDAAAGGNTREEVRTT